MPMPDDASPPAAQSTPATEATSSAVAQSPTGEGGNIPDPCTLLSDAEVTTLTGRDITQIDSSRKMISPLKCP